ncbi:MAG: DUF2264 domain-containing protein, partial [bacterium]|nr:DUF2264 domain-containing protein [bacterium]
VSTRMFGALAAWLSDPKRPRQFEIRGQEVDVEALTVAILERAFDPEQPGFWGKEAFPARDQRTVESAILAYGAWLLRDTVLPEISERGMLCFRDWLRYFASAPLVQNNWNLFWIVNHTARKALGWDYEQDTIDEAWETIDGYHRGDGWMTDGSEQLFDDTNWWVFGIHEIFWMQMDGEANPERCARVEDRIRNRLEVYPYFFGKDGSVSEYGRSLSYKFARLACPILAYKLGFWPHSTGMLKRLVRKHLAFYDNNGALDRVTDTVRQTLSEFGHPAVRDTYINTGHPYWCMATFAALWQLDEDDPLWTVEEEPLPVEGQDFQKVVKPAGWILTGTQATGQVQRHSLGTRHGRKYYAAKYGKFMYGTHFPVNLGSVEGDFGADSALCVTDGDHWAHPGNYEVFVAEAHYLRAAYHLEIGGMKIPVETVLIPQGELCLRTHWILVPEGAPPLTAVEGGAALGYEPGFTPEKLVDQEAIYSLVTLGSKASLIYGISGYSYAVRAQGFRGNEQLNGIYDRAITPVLEVEDLTEIPGGEVGLVCLTVATLQWQPEMLVGLEMAVEWQEDGVVDVVFGDLELTIPPLERA